MFGWKAAGLAGLALLAVAGAAWGWVQILQHELAAARAGLEAARSAVDQAVEANVQTLETVRQQHEQFAHAMRTLGAFDRQVAAHRTDLEALRREISDAADSNACVDSAPVRAVIERLQRRAAGAAGGHRSAPGAAGGHP